MRKISSDDTVINKYILPYFFLALMVILIIVFYFNRNILILPLPIFIFIGLFLTGNFYFMINLSNVWVNEEENVFIINTGRKKLKIPFNQLTEMKFRSRRRMIVLRFTDKTIYFMPQSNDIMDLNVDNVMNYLDDLMARKWQPPQ